MKVKVVKEEHREITWENGRHAQLYAVVWKESEQKECVLGVFDSKFWAESFVNKAATISRLTVREIIR